LIWNLLWMEWKGVFFKSCFLVVLFFNTIVAYDGNGKHIFSNLCINFVFWFFKDWIELKFNFNPIWTQSTLEIWNELKWIASKLNKILDSIPCTWIEFQFNSSCMQCHLIFSFKWDLIFTKSISFSHHLIVTSNCIS
jgi:hypothetical protein